MRRVFRQVMTGLVSILVIRMRRNTAVNRGDTVRESERADERASERAKGERKLLSAGRATLTRCSHATHAATQRHRTTTTSSSGWTRFLLETVNTAAFIAHRGHVTVDKAYFALFVDHTLRVGALLITFTYLVHLLLNWNNTGYGRKKWTCS